MVERILIFRPRHIYLWWLLAGALDNSCNERVPIDMKNFQSILYSVLAIAFGVFMVVYGGYDDSPGAQMLGLIAVVVGIVVAIQSRKNNFD